MKKLVISAAFSTLLGIGVAMAAPAQDQSTPPPSGAAPQTQGQAGQHQPDPARQIRVLARRLNLNAEQQNQILPVLNERAQQTQAIRSDNSLSEQDRHAKMKAVREDTDARIEAALTADQKQEYNQMKQQAHERARHNRQNQSQGSGSSN